MRLVRPRYRSNSVFSERKVDVPFETPRQSTNGDPGWQWQKLSESAGAFFPLLHRILLWPDEYWLRGIRGLLKGCGTRREKGDNCSDCSAGASCRWVEVPESRSSNASFSGGKSASSCPTAPDSVAEWWLPGSD